MAEEKKKVLIFSHVLEIGGAEKALLGLLETFDTDRFDVSLFLMRHEGDWLKYVPGNIHLLPEIAQYTCMAVPIREVLKKHQYRVALGRLIGKQKAKRYVRVNALGGLNDVALQYSHKYTCSAMPDIPGEYDLAISFLTPHYYVAKKVKAKKKIAWIHTDYSSVNMDAQEQYRMWSEYDHIISISDACTEGFLKKMPALKDKIVRIDHIMPMQLIRKLASEEQDDMKYDGMKLLSAGRFTYAKNFENIPRICREIKDHGVDLKWYLIGFGDQYEKKIRDNIKACGMEDHVIILGKRNNPYPYIRSCDVYVQPSRYEGKSITVLEAQILHKPVIITDYSTAKSQLEDGFDGMIVPTELHECAMAITKILKDPSLLKQLSSNTYSRNYSNSDEIRKLCQLCTEQDLPGE